MSGRYSVDYGTGTRVLGQYLVFTPPPEWGFTFWYSICPAPHSHEWLRKSLNKQFLFEKGFGGEIFNPQLYVKRLF